MIRGAGSIAIALPWLEIMGRAGPGRAARRAGPPLRGRVPAGRHGAVDSTRPPAARPRSPWARSCSRSRRCRSKLLVLDGLDMKSAVGEQHQAGIVALLTGTPQKDGGSGYAAGPVDRSGDRHAASPRGKKPRASIQMAVRWATGKSKGRLHPINVAQLRGQRHLQPHPAAPGPGADLRRPVRHARRRRATRGRGAPRRASSRSSTTSAGATQTLAARLGAADRQKLEQHLTKIREIERGLGTPARPGPCRRRACQAPGAGRHLGLQPAHRPQLRRQRQRSSTPAPTPPSPRSAST